MVEGLFGGVLGFLLFPVAVRLLLGVARALGVYDVVPERTAHVYVLFGKVVATLDEPGLYWLWARLGPTAAVIRWLGKRYAVDLRLDQQYLRSLAVNSEEGAPMGIGVWFEMSVKDPVRFLFENADPRGSLAANVSNATVRSLSNLRLAEMLENRHAMSRSVRTEVSPKSEAWGYRLGSVYIRKVHFRDSGMIRQIEEKVVNRLRQVTSAIQQDGANQVSVVTSTAERQAAVEFAKAAALRPRIVGGALRKIALNPRVAQAMFELLEIQRLTQGNGQLTLLPPGATRGPLAELLASKGPPAPARR